MKAHIALTVVWLSSFLLALAIVEAYFLRSTAAGIPFLLSSHRVLVYKWIGVLYGTNLAPILVGWFTKPFPKPSEVRYAKFIFWLALILTILYNVILLYLIGQGHFAQDDSIEVILERVKLISGSLTFLVAPVNYYYFGIKGNG